MKFDEVVVQSDYYNITKFYQIVMKTKNILYTTHLTDGPLTRVMFHMTISMDM